MVMAWWAVFVMCCEVKVEVEEVKEVEGAGAGRSF
jgi:hypothetical protein